MPEVITVPGVPYVATYLEETQPWMLGSIQGEEIVDPADRLYVAQSILQAVEPVTASRPKQTTCTDSRNRLGTADGNPEAVVAEQLVGMALVTSFAIAESLDGFYPRDDMTIEERLEYTAWFIEEDDEVVNRHRGCGGGDSFDVILGNGVILGRDRSYRNRNRDLLPSGLYDEKLFSKIHATTGEKIEAGVYRGYKGQMITDTVERRGGDRDVEIYDDDGRGVHGHRESVVARLTPEVGGVALSPGALAGFDDLQAFAVNGSSQRRLAELFSNGGANAEAYATAYIAAEHFTNAAHGTLGHNLPTLVISRA